MAPPVLVITPGDPEGIGPEILIKLIREKRIPKKHTLIVVGDYRPFSKSKIPFFLLDPEDCFKKNAARLYRSHPYFFIPAPIPVTLASKKDFSLPGFQSGWSVVMATELVRHKLAKAMVTGPISKERLIRGGFKFSGHTELLAHLFRNKSKPCDVTMMLSNADLNVALVTTHLALRDVAAAITKERILKTIEQTVALLKSTPGLQKRIAVLGLNPHAGEGGAFGNEEIKIILPAVQKAKNRFKDFKITGPHPADTFFAVNQMKPKKDRAGAVVCMYHDQALIPIKLLDFKRTINITLGLPILRTSVDHGTAFDLVGKNKADATSLQCAMEWASRFG